MSQESRTRIERSDAEGQTILVVDDQAVIRVQLEGLLEASGYEVFTAENGEEALAIVGRGGVSLVLLDLRMPGMDGVETCHRLRQDMRERFVPVIMVTSVEDQGARIRSIEAGVDDFLTKPVDAVELIARVRSLLKLKAYYDLRENQRDELERELQEMRQHVLRLEHMATLGTLASAVGHELRNIASIQEGTLEIMRECATEARPPSDRELAALRHVAEHITNHGRNLLALGHPQKEVVKAIELPALVENVISLLQSAGRAKVVTIETDFASPARVRVSPLRIEQVLINLVTNAVDAVDQTPERNGKICVEVRPAGSRVVCRVRDNGCGIPAESLDRVFDYYFTTKPHGKGTGLGLTVVRQIVESYGGTVTIESRPGEGTQVAFEIPAADHEDTAG